MTARIEQLQRGSESHANGCRTNAHEQTLGAELSEQPRWRRAERESDVQPARPSATPRAMNIVARLLHAMAMTPASRRA